MYFIFIVIVLFLTSCSQEGTEIYNKVIKPILPESQPIKPEPMPFIFETTYQRLVQEFALTDNLYIIVVISEQKLYVLQNQEIIKEYPVSTSAYGIGNQEGSGKTPLGIHKISERFGENAPKGMIFKGRQATGEIANIITEKLDIEADVITSRILWLQGLEPGLNQGENIDSHDRYIYIHGTAEEGLIGQPASHGCVRMYNNDVIQLFEKIPLNTLVVIKE